MGGCVKSVLGVATGLVFRTHQVPNGKETESTLISNSGYMKGQLDIRLINLRYQIVIGSIMSIVFENAD